MRFDIREFDIMGFVVRSLLKLWWFLVLIVVIKLMWSSASKGIWGEWFVDIVARLRLDKDTYHRLSNVTIPTPDGTTQIDHVLVSRYGVFVIETKNMKGWIFGRERDAQWTQSMYGNKRRFQNPLRQNCKHVKALEATLGVLPETIHSVITFVGDAVLKTELPSNVTIGGGFVRFVRSFTAPVFDEREVERILGALKAKRLAPTRATHRAHVNALKQRHAPQRVVLLPHDAMRPAPQRPAPQPQPLQSEEAHPELPASSQPCPECGSPLVLRTVWRGHGAGTKYWGCSTSPACRYTRPADAASAPGGGPEQKRRGA